VDQLGLVRRHQANVMSNNISDVGKNRIAEVLRHDRFIENMVLSGLPTNCSNGSGRAIGGRRHTKEAKPAA
jgi:hypothetical protein